jgi:anaerobic ribonucleoside-triphosphate reductase activating protein
MNYSALYKEDYANGEGVRVTLFVSGCVHGCKGCHNVNAQNPKYGMEFTDETLGEILEAMERAQGFTVSGGDPLHPRNRTRVRHICDVVKRHYPDKDIWMWTGYKYEDLDEYQRSVLRSVDVLIDGKYEMNRPPAPWRGSDNQRIIKIREVE